MTDGASLSSAAVRCHGLLVDLRHMDDQARGRVEFFIAVDAFKMLGFLMRYQYLFVLKLPVAIPTQRERGRFTVPAGHKQHLLTNTRACLPPSSCASFPSPKNVPSATSGDTSKAVFVSSGPSKPAHQRGNLDLPFSSPNGQSLQTESARQRSVEMIGTTWP